jgi:putative membrane protein
MSFDPAPAVVVPAAAALLLFLRGFLRLRRRGRRDHAGRGRAALFGAGLACLVLPLVSPVGAAAHRSLAAHMLEHVLIGDAAPALLLVALRGLLLFFVVPAPVLRALAPLRRSFRPLYALCAWTLALAAWHIPAAYDFALHHGAAHELEHVSFVLAGFLVWTQLVDPTRHGRLSVPQRLAFAGALFGLGQPLGMLLLLASHPLYPAYGALRDQQLAGLIMMAEQLLTLGTCAVVLLRSAATTAPRVVRPLPV